MLFRSGKGYSSYLWQDGSVADTLLVTSPGTYSVTVTNTCGVPHSDVAEVKQAPSLDFSIGPDLSTCLNDSVILKAPDGYSDYSWTGTDMADKYTTPQIKIAPRTSVFYYASARTDLGCVVKDAVAITVKTPLAVSLGKDSSFCKGDSILLDAGNVFLNYLWNNGSTGHSIFARQQGAYWVKVQSPNGCFSYDTMQVVRVYPLPAVRLDPADWLCEGSTRTLDAGNNYVSYLWKDGTTLPTLQVNTTGTYWVQVTDDKECSGGDTVTIRQIVPNPTGFLASDTVICDAWPSKIPAKGQFVSYAWNTGETKNYITVSHEGSYSLAVTDSYGCSATENISITTKQCLFGIYFPNAFTPDGDGANDLFRPYALGNILHYQLQVFNRWGQMVFATEDYNRGWNGTVNGVAQPTGTYVWISRYQFGGEGEKVDKGTVLLIRK